MSSDVGRAGRRAYQRVHEAQFTFLRMNVRVVGLWVLFVAGVAVVAQLVMPDPGRPYVVGGLIAAGALMLWFLAGAATGSWNCWMGALAEQHTHDDLKALRRRGFAVFDSVLGDGFDVDHVAIGAEHVFAIEVKWSTRRWDVERPERDPTLQTALYAARRGAKRIRVY